LTTLISSFEIYLSSGAYWIFYNMHFFRSMISFYCLNKYHVLILQIWATFNSYNWMQVNNKFSFCIACQNYLVSIKLWSR
jgi:hypothetical protein